MNIHRCPGQEARQWTPKDIFEVPCHKCGKPIEFFKDDPDRECPSCGETCLTPKLNKGCLEWCAHANACRQLFSGDPKEREQ